MNRDAPWMKIIMYVFGVIVMVSIVKVLFQSGLGTVNESRRVNHPAGFSMVMPAGWTYEISRGRTTDTLRFDPEQASGRRPSITLIRRVPGVGEVPAQLADAQSATFQGQPAKILARKQKYEWGWECFFTRDGADYHLRLITPMQEKVESSPYMAFFNSFRLETPATTLPADAIRSDASLPEPVLPIVTPATEPAS